MWFQTKIHSSILNPHSINSQHSKNKNEGSSAPVWTPLPCRAEVLLLSARVLLVDFSTPLPRPLTSCPYAVAVEAGWNDEGSGGMMMVKPHRHQKQHGFLEVFQTMKTKNSPLEVVNYKLGGGFKDFLFSPYLGKIPILTNVFQMGWNHQPVNPY